MVRKIIVGFCLFAAAGLSLCMLILGEESVGFVLPLAVFYLMFAAVVYSLKSKTGEGRTDTAWGVIRKIIIGFFCCIAVTSVLVMMFEGEKSVVEMLAPTLGCLMFAAIAYLCKGKTREEKKEWAEGKKRAEERVERTIVYNHASGLPLAGGTVCRVTFRDNHIDISGGGRMFSLPYSRITNMQLADSIGVHESYVSSVGGAIGGAALFGTLGGMAGGRVRERRTQTWEMFFIIKYEKDGATEYIYFSTDQQQQVDRAEKLISNKCGYNPYKSEEFEL